MRFGSQHDLASMEIVRLGVGTTAVAEPLMWLALTWMVGWRRKSC